MIMMIMVHSHVDDYAVDDDEDYAVDDEDNYVDDDEDDQKDLQMVDQRHGLSPQPPMDKRQILKGPNMINFKRFKSDQFQKVQM